MGRHLGGGEVGLQAGDLLGPEVDEVLRILNVERDRVRHVRMGRVRPGDGRSTRQRVVGVGAS
jgi:hypothetical protein